MTTDEFLLMMQNSLVNLPEKIRVFFVKVGDDKINEPYNSEKENEEEEEEITE